MLRFTRWTRWTTRQATTASARGRQPQLARKRSYTSFFASGCGIGGCAWSALARGNDQQLSVRPASPGSRAPGCRLPSSPEPAPLRKKITARTRPHRTPPRFIGRHPRPPSVSVYIQCIMILSLKGCVQVVRDDTRDRFGQYTALRYQGVVSCELLAFGDLGLRHGLRHGLRSALWDLKIVILVENHPEKRCFWLAD
jgi:hypothetical protein